MGARLAFKLGIAPPRTFSQRDETLTLALALPLTLNPKL